VKIEVYNYRRFSGGVLEWFWDTLRRNLDEKKCDVLPWVPL